MLNSFSPGNFRKLLRRLAVLALLASKASAADHIDHFNSFLLCYWDFNQTAGLGISADRVAGYAGFVEGGAQITADGGGASGKPGDRALRLGTGAQRLRIPNPSFLQNLITFEAITVSFSIRQTTTRASMAFYVENPAYADPRALSAHLPWPDGNLYFDSAGCCGPSQRLSAPAGNLQWSQWHHVVLIRNRAERKIIIDGNTVATGSGVPALMAGFTQLILGNGPSYNQAVDGEIDNLAIFSATPTSAQIFQLGSDQKTNTAPGFVSSSDQDGDSLADTWEGAYFPGDLTKLTAGNADFDGDGLTDKQEFDSGLSPANPDSDGDYLKDGAENNTGTFVGLNIAGTSPRQTDSDGDGWPDGFEVFSGTNPVDAASRPIPFGNGTTLMAWWPFSNPQGPTESLDVIGSYKGTLNGAVYTPGGGGRTGTASDLALRISGGSQRMEVKAASWVNFASGSNNMTVSFWQKLNTVPEASSFWFFSPSSSGQRGFQAHVPYGESGTLYFDTSGCCDPATRLSGIPTPAKDWRAWRHCAFMMNNGTKTIWIDGQKVMGGPGAAPLPNDFVAFHVGAADTGGSLDGFIDDFAVYAGALTPVQIGRLASGETPQGILGAPPPDDDSFRVISIARNVNQTFDLTWQSKPGLTYSIEGWSGAGVWQTLQTNLPSTGPTTSSQLPGVPFGRYFYRVRRQE